MVLWSPLMDESYMQKAPLHQSVEESYYAQSSRVTPSFQMKQFSASTTEFDTSYYPQNNIPAPTNFAPSISIGAIPPHNPGMVMGAGNYAQQGYLFHLTKHNRRQDIKTNTLITSLTSPSHDKQVRA